MLKNRALSYLGVFAVDILVSKNCYLQQIVTQSVSNVVPLGRIEEVSEDVRLVLDDGGN